MKSRTYHLLQALGAVLILTLGLTGGCHGAEAALPTFREVPGHLVKNQCDPFSRLAAVKLHKAGIPAVRVFIKILNPPAFHAAVIFKLDGKHYVMDNEHAAPMRVKGRTDLSAALRLVGGGDGGVYMADRNGLKVPPQKLADVFTFAQLPAWLDSTLVDKVGDCPR